MLEGAWNGDKVVVLEFDDDQSARAWANSAEYRAIAADRLAATDGLALLVAGMT